jgi:hypothetical protein
MIATAARPSALTPLAQRQQSFSSFPKQYLTIRKLRGTEITFRAIRPEDEPLLLEFHKTVSDQSVTLGILAM